MTDALPTGAPAAVARVATVVERRVDSSLVRVKIWNASGKIVYSNEPRLIGADLPARADELEALRAASSMPG